MSPPHRFAVLGRPIAESRSPAIHAEALRLANLEGTYEAVDADSDVLANWMNRVRSGEADGLNVTMPLKLRAFELADALTSEAEASGSVNTVRLRDERLEGHSTDVVAVRQALTAERFRALESVLVLGGGGSARAALEGGRDRNRYIQTRDPGQARALSAAFECQPLAWGTAVAGALVINATPIGMHGECLESQLLEACGGLIDLPYGLDRTQSLVAVEAMNRPVLDGFEFLAMQARASFQWWTGRDVSLAPLIAAARKG